LVVHSGLGIDIDLGLSTPTVEVAVKADGGIILTASSQNNGMP
jgi:hypothetical protein